MISPLSIAIGGFRPGSSPIEIASNGLIVRIQPAPLEEDVECGLYPVRFGPPPKRQQDCTVEVTGCEATLSATAWNLWDYTSEENLFATPEGQAVLLKYHLWMQRVAHKRKSDVKVLRRAESHRLRSERMQAQRVGAKLRERDLAELSKCKPGEFHRRGSAVLYFSENVEVLEKENAKLQKEIAALKKQIADQDREARREWSRKNEPHLWFPKNSKGELVRDPEPKKAPPRRKK